MTMVENLKAMGFTDDQIQAGLQATGSKELETVVNWILNNPDVQPADGSAWTTSGGATGGGGQVLGGPPGAVGGGQTLGGGSESNTATPQPTPSSQEVAMSLKCEDCGRLLRNTIEAEAHAAKSGHSNFAETTEEIKPLTEEEKKKKLEDLQEKMRQRRVEREEREKQEAIEKERLRRREGQSLSNIKDDFERKEMMRAAEERRRQKEEDRLAREKVKADIARDRASKKLAQESSDAASPAALDTPGLAGPSPNGATPPPKTSADYTETRIQIRFKGAPPKVQKFKTQETLSAVRLFVQLNAPTPLSPNFSLMTTFPKKVFTEDDMERPLFDLGLVPSAVLDIHQPN